MRVRPQVHNSNVPLTDTENVARDLRLGTQLVELDLGNRLDARYASRNEARKALRTSLILRFVVPFDRAKRQARALERSGRVHNVVGIPKHFVCEPHEDDGSKLGPLVERIEDVIDLRRAVAFIVLRARIHDQMQLARQRELLARDPEAHPIEEVRLRANSDDVRIRLVENADRARSETHRQIAQIATVRLVFEDDQIDEVGIDLSPAYETRQDRA